MLSLTLVLFCISVFMSAPQSEAAPLPIMDVVASNAQLPNVPENTLDGVLARRWSSQGDGQWIRYELELCDTVAAVRIAWHSGDRRTSSFGIEVSDFADGPWTSVHSGESSGTTLELETVDIEDVAACFVRIVEHGDSRSDRIGITEVEFMHTIE